MNPADAPRIDHARAWIAAAVVGFGASSLIALRTSIPAWERDVTSTVNDGPDAVATLTWPIMQLGTFIAPVAIGAFAFARGRRRLVTNVTISGLAAWFVAKGVKQVFGRGRPISYLPELEIRDGNGSGLGFPAGHSAVAAACAVCVISAVPRRWRPVAAVLATGVGLARIVHGVHFPTDVVGGWSLGVVIGVAVTRLAERTMSATDET